MKTKEKIAFIKEKISQMYVDIPVDFGGGCSVLKGTAIALLIAELDLQRSADIGVYRGRSFFPQGMAHETFTGGLVFGIDPYDNVAAEQTDRKDIKRSLL